MTTRPRSHPQEPDLLRGSIDMLILKALSLESMHGWGIGVRFPAQWDPKLGIHVT